MVFVKPSEWDEAHFYYVCYTIGNINNSCTSMICTDSRLTALKTIMKNKWTVTLFLEISEYEYNVLMEELDETLNNPI